MEKKKIERLALYKEIIIIIITVFTSCIFTNIIVSSNSQSGIIVHMLMYSAIFIILLSVFKKKTPTIIIINTLEFIFAVACRIKLDTRSQILEPWDMSFVKNLGDFRTFLSFNEIFIIDITIAVVLVILITIVQIFIFNMFLKIPNSKFVKIGFVSIAIITIFFLVTSYIPIKMKIIYPQKTGYANYWPYEKVEKYGALTTFLLDIGIMNYNDKPSEYSEEKIEEIKEEYKEYEIPSQNMMNYDNVIVILLESFVDVNNWPNVNFKKNPLENYYKYCTETNNGELNVTNIGGGTSDVEYSVLSMYSMEQHPKGLYAYMNFIKRDTNTLVSLFKSNGYNTTRNTHI